MGRIHVGRPTMNLEFSQKAMEKILHFLKESQEPCALRIVANHIEGEKYGFKFELEPLSAHRPEDVVVEKEGVTVRLDGTSAKNVEGGRVDWLDESNPGFTVLNLSAPKVAESSEELEVQVYDAIKTIFDPEIPSVNIHDLGLIYGVSVDDAKNVKVVMTLTAPNCPAAEQLPAEVKTNVEKIPGVKSAEVKITFDPAWTPERMSEAAKLTLNLL